MAKYSGKHDLEKGTSLKVIRSIQTSYGILSIGQVVTLIEVTHFPTSYTVEDESKQTWMLRTHDVEVLPTE